MMVDTPTPKANKEVVFLFILLNKATKATTTATATATKIAPVARTTTSTPVKVQDSTISKKIDEFVRLRSRIAAGNKTPEYRLHWVKMLIVATNYKLYSYINIKENLFIKNKQYQIKLNL